MTSITQDFEHREDGHLYRTYSDRNVKKGDAFGCVAPNGYIEGFYRGVKTSEHRLVWEFHNGPIPEGFKIDHEDHDTTNNRIGNLRLATHGQNMHNRLVNKNSKTGVKGVILYSYQGGTVYRAKVAVNGKRSNKIFPLTDEGLADATKWVEAKREQLHQEFMHHGN